MNYSASTSKSSSLHGFDKLRQVLRTSFDWPNPSWERVWATARRHFFLWSPPKGLLECHFWSWVWLRKFVFGQYLELRAGKLCIKNFSNSTMWRWTMGNAEMAYKNTNPNLKWPHVREYIVFVAEQQIELLRWDIGSRQISRIAIHVPWRRRQFGAKGKTRSKPTAVEMEMKA